MVHDIYVDHSIWGKSAPYLKLKTTKKKPIPVAGDLIQVLKELVKLHKDIYLMEDLFFVNSIPFFLNLSRKIFFSSVKHLANRELNSTFKAFKEIYIYYMKRGFHITTLNLDGEFSQLQAMVYENIPGGPRINITSAKKHVSDIKRLLRVVKERTRAVRHNLHFNKSLKLLTLYIAFTVVRMLKYLPVKIGISSILSPQTIIYGEKIHYKRHIWLNIR